MISVQNPNNPIQNLRIPNEILSVPLTSFQEIWGGATSPIYYLTDCLAWKIYVLLNGQDNPISPPYLNSIPRLLQKTQGPGIHNAWRGGIPYLAPCP